MKMSVVTVGAGATIGTRAIVLYDAVVGDDVVLGSLSLLMKGEHLTPGTRWRGIPAQGMHHPAGDHRRPSPPNRRSAAACTRYRRTVPPHTKERTIREHRTAGLRRRPLPHRLRDQPVHAHRGATRPGRGGRRARDDRGRAPGGRPPPSSTCRRHRSARTWSSPPTPPWSAATGRCWAARRRSARRRSPYFQEWLSRPRLRRDRGAVPVQRTGRRAGLRRPAARRLRAAHRPADARRARRGAGLRRGAAAHRRARAGTTSTWPSPSSTPGTVAYCPQALDEPSRGACAASAWT